MACCAAFAAEDRHEIARMQQEIIKLRTEVSFVELDKGFPFMGALGFGFFCSTWGCPKRSQNHFLFGCLGTYISGDYGQGLLDDFGWEKMFPGQGVPEHPMLPAWGWDRSWKSHQHNSLSIYTELYWYILYIPLYTHDFSWCTYMGYNKPILSAPILCSTPMWFQKPSPAGVAWPWTSQQCISSVATRGVSWVDLSPRHF